LEKRAFLALILSLAVFVGWGYFLASVQGPQSKGKETAPTVNGKKSASAVPATPTSPSADKDSASAPTAPAEATAPTVPESIISVSSGWISYGISTKGGGVKELLVQKYMGVGHPPTNLAAHENGAPNPLSLESTNPELTRILQTSVYEASATALELNSSHTEATLTLTLKHPSGVEVLREYRFHYNSYLVDLHVEIKAPAHAAENLQYTILWGPRLGGGTDSRAESFIHTGPTTFINNERVETNEDDLAEPLRQQGELEWTAFQNKYFAAALLPRKGVKAAVTKKLPGGAYVGLELETVRAETVADIQLYAGTKELQILEGLNNKLVRLIDYGWLGNKFAFLVKPMLRVLQFFYDMTHNYGWSIIILTVCVKLLFFPLTHKSFKSMRGMTKIQPYVKIIQERNKDDRNKMNEELMELYRKNKVNPLGGCLPMLLQIPVFISLYHALFFSIELRGAPFMFWIVDLSESDPYYITPILMGVSMVLQQRMSPAVGDPIQQKIMMFMPIMFTFMFLSFPSGLVIYWTVNNVLTIAQQYYIYKIAAD
jgi:YidC/Oxa1 family membrane protein insertase